MNGRRRTDQEHSDHPFPGRTIHLCKRGVRARGQLQTRESFRTAEEMGLDIGEMLEELDRMMRERKAVEV